MNSRLGFIRDGPVQSKETDGDWVVGIRIFGSRIAEGLSVLTEMVVPRPGLETSRKKITAKSALIRYDYVVRLQKAGNVFDKKRRRFFHMDIIALRMPKAKDMS